MTVSLKASISVVSGSYKTDALDQYLSWIPGLYLLIQPLGIPDHLHIQTTRYLKVLPQLSPHTPCMLS